MANSVNENNKTFELNKEMQQNVFWNSSLLQTSITNKLRTNL